MRSLLITMKLSRKLSKPPSPKRQMPFLVPARRPPESLEQYIQRVRALEDLANSFKGVSQSFALQAGREVRIFVKPEDIDDLESIRLARDIAKNIEETMHYPGQIKVTVIRETRAVDYAK